MPNNTSATAGAGISPGLDWNTLVLNNSISTSPPSPEHYGTPEWALDVAYDDPYVRRGKNMDKEKFYNKPLMGFFGFRNGKKPGRIGLEIECEGTHLFTIPFKYWTCHSDGSLRETAGHAPTEYVLKEPLDYDELTKALAYLTVKLKEAGSSIHESTRTSVHVHVNVQDLSVRQLYCYILMYIIFEEVLVEWSGPDRVGNLFCLRAKDSEFYISMLEKALKEEHFKLWNENYRYAACNVASVPKFGSLEFRSLRGTVDTNLISTWVSILLLLREKSLEYDNPIEIVEEFISIGPLPFFKKIFKDTKLRELFTDIPNLSGKLWTGLRLMRDVAYSCEWVPPMKKKDNPEESSQQEKPRYLRGQIISVGSGLDTRTREVQCHSAYGVPRPWRVVDVYNNSHDYSPSYTFNQPPGTTMYFVVSLPGLDSTYLLLDIRDGEPETVSDFDMPDISDNDEFIEPEPEEENDDEGNN